MLCATVEGYEATFRERVKADKVDGLFEALVQTTTRVKAPAANNALVLIIDALDELPRDALKPVLSLLATN